MEMIRPRRSVLYPIVDESQVGEARRAAASLAAWLKLDETTSGRLSIIVTELGANLLKYASQGRLIFNVPSSGSVEVLSVDSGPGMNVNQCLRDGFSTAGTPGTGLGAVQRLATEFDVYSLPGRGTSLLARIGGSPPRPGSLLHGGVSLPLPGESECGDAWDHTAVGGMERLIVVDGLGHGPLAARAAATAVAMFHDFMHEPLEGALMRIHEGLRQTRGAAVLLVELDPARRVVRHVSVGNITARLLDGITSRELLAYNGTAGVEIRKVQEIQTPWPENGILVAHTDGLQSRWDLSGYPGLLVRDPALIAATLCRDAVRGRDDATIVACRWAS